MYIKGEGTCNSYNGFIDSTVPIVTKIRYPCMQVEVHVHVCRWVVYESLSMHKINTSKVTAGCVRQSVHCTYTCNYIMYNRVQCV